MFNGALGTAGAEYLEDGMKYQEDNLLVMSQATSREMVDLIKGWAAQLGTVTLHTGSEFHELPSNVRIVSAPSYSNKSYLSRLITWSRYLIHAAGVVARLRGKPLIFLSSNPPLLALVGFLAKRLHGTPYIVHVLDVFPDVIVKAGLASKRNLVVRMWAALNRLCYKHAEAVITLGPIMGETVAQYLVDKSKLVIVPYGVDPSALNPMQKEDNPFAVEHEQVQKLTVLYSGNYGLTHDLSGLFGAARMMSSDKDISFMLVGGGGRSHEMMEVADDCSNVAYLPFQPLEVVPYSMACAEVGVVTLGAKSAGISLPSKAYYLMAAGCALLGLSKGKNDIAALIKRYECGINVESDEPEAVHEAILKFKNDPDFLARCRSNSRKAAEEGLSIDSCKQQFDTLFANLRSA